MNAMLFIFLVTSRYSNYLKVEIFFWHSNILHWSRWNLTMEQHTVHSFLHRFP